MANIGRRSRVGEIPTGRPQIGLHNPNASPDCSAASSRRSLNGLSIRLSLQPGLTVERILVIDDDPSVTNVIKRGLVYEGYAVDTAATGAQGLTIARDRAPDLVILDVVLPGLDATTSSRALGRHVYASSGRARPDYRD
jgi:PleD family two-component response regulator